MAHVKVCYFLCLSLLSVAARQLENDSRFNVELKHAVDIDDSENFTHRGNVTILSSNSGLYKCDQQMLTEAEQKTINILAQQKGIYRLKATVVYLDGSEQVFLTSASACNMVLSQLEDVLWLSVDESGHVKAISLLTPSNSRILGHCSNMKPDTDALPNFKTDVLILKPELAPEPVIESKTEYGFGGLNMGLVAYYSNLISKYWLYIVGFGLIILGAAQK